MATLEKILFGYSILGLILTYSLFSSAYATSNSCKCVAFRLDDVQDYYLNKAQIGVINEFEKYDKSLTIGIIGNYFGNDTKLVNFIKENLAKKDPSIEIANHGFNHEDFTLYGKNEQEQLVNKSNKKIFDTLQVDPFGFIPPFNKVSANMIEVLNKNHIKYISANVTQDLPPYEMGNQSINHLPGTGFTGDYMDDFWLGSPHYDSFAQVQDSLIRYGFSVVMLHPQEYSKRQGLVFSNEIDSSQMKELDSLIQDIEYNGIEVVTIGQIPLHYNTHQHIPSWVKNLLNWYEDRKISSKEFNDAIEFLNKNSIIKYETNS